MNRPNVHELDRYTRSGKLAMKTGAFLVVMTLLGALYVHSAQEPPSHVLRAPEAASAGAPVPPPASFPSASDIPVMQPAEPVPTF